MWHAHKSSVAETKLILKKALKGINAIIDIMKTAAQSIVKLAHIVTITYNLGHCKSRTVTQLEVSANSKG